MSMGITEVIDIYNNIPQGKQNPIGMDKDAEFVQQRFYAMSLSKQNRRNVWQGIQSLYYCDDWTWIIDGGDVWNKSVRFPTLRDVTKTLTDTFMQDPPGIVLSPKNKDDEFAARGKMAYLEGRSQSVHEKKVRRQVIEDMFFYGVGIRVPNFMEIERAYPSSKKKGMVDKHLFCDVASYRLDPRDFFIDETANMLHDDLRMNGARDCIVRQVLPYSTFLARYDNMEGFTTKGVRPVPWIEAMGIDYLAMNTREIMEKTPSNVVKLYVYMNQETDQYIVVANGVTIFKGSLYLTQGTTKLPVVMYKFEDRNDSVWGQSLGELIAPHIYTRDTVYNLELMNLKLALQPVLAVSGDFGYNPRVHVLQPGGVWTAGGSLQGRLADHIQPVISGNENTKAGEMMQMISGELSVTSRTDIRNLQFQKEKTATEVMNNSQSMQAHNEFIEVVAEVEAEAMLFDIWNEQMMMFMNESVGTKKEKRRVKIKNFIVSETSERGVRFHEQQGYEDEFLLGQDMIDAEVDITATDKRGDKVAKVEKIGRMMQAIPVIGNIAQLDPTLLQSINFQYFLEELVSALDLDPMKSFKKDSEYLDEYQIVKEEILLGHNVDIPDETRKESLDRLKWLTVLKDTTELNQSQLRAWMYHMGQTVENISANQIEKQQQKLQEEQIRKQAEAQGVMLPPGPQRENMNKQQQSQQQAAAQANAPQPGAQPKTMPMPDGNVIGPTSQIPK